MNSRMDWTTLAVGAALGAFLGIGSSIMGWFLVQRVRPQFRWSSDISELVGSKTGHSYCRVKVINESRRRAIEVRFSAQLWVRGLVLEAGSNWLLVEIPLKTSWLPIMPNQFLVRLRTHAIDPDQLRQVSGEMRHELGTGTAGVRELLALGTESYLELVAIGYDEFTGARRAAVSPRLRSSSVRRGRYETGSSLKVKASSDSRLLLDGVLWNEDESQ